MTICSYRYLVFIVTCWFINTRHPLRLNIGVSSTCAAFKNLLLAKEIFPTNKLPREWNFALSGVIGCVACVWCIDVPRLRSYKLMRVVRVSDSHAPRARMDLTPCKH